MRCRAVVRPMIVWFVASAWCCVASADTIHLKNGNTLKGHIIRTNGQEVVIEVPELGTMTVRREEIASIEQAPAGPSTTGTSESNEVQDYVSWQDASDQAVRLYQRRQFQAAEETAKRAMQMAETFFGPTHSEVAKSAGLVGAILKDQGKSTEAEPFFALALRIWEGMEGSHQPTVASALQELAAVDVLQEKYAQAEPLLYRAVAIRENLLNPHDPDLAVALEQYAEVLTKLGRTELARQMAEESHTIRSTKRRPSPVDEN